MSDELERNHPVDDEETQDDDVEAHRKHKDANDEGDSDDFEAHRKGTGA
jgi:hypothetical protein